MRELAVRLSLDTDVFLSSVERFNKYAKEGKDPDFKRGENDRAVKFLGDPSHKPRSLLRPIERGPFVGMNWRIVDTGIGNSGYSNCRGLTYGYLAVEHIKDKRQA